MQASLGQGVHPPGREPLCCWTRVQEGIEFIPGLKGAARLAGTAGLESWAGALRVIFRPALTMWAKLHIADVTSSIRLMDCEITTVDNFVSSPEFLFRFPVIWYSELSVFRGQRSSVHPESRSHECMQ